MPTTPSATPWPHTGATTNPFQYYGEEYDPSLQMYYLRARYYGPQIGRFLTRDNYAGDDEAPPSLNGYVYAAADPINKKDSSGHAIDEEVALASARQDEEIAVLGRETAVTPYSCSPFCTTCSPPAGRFSISGNRIYRCIRVSRSRVGICLSRGIQWKRFWGAVTFAVIFGGPAGDYYTHKRLCRQKLGINIVVN
jgi:RHS repeat-associated protein